VEHYYLNTCDSTLAESFYGLKRVRLLPSSPSVKGEGKDTKDTAPLQDVDRQRALLFMVGVPYVKNRLDNFYIRLSGNIPDNDDLALSQQEINEIMDAHQVPPRLTPMERLFVKIYPWFHALYEGLSFLYQLRYLFEFSSHFSPWLHLIRQKIVRLSMEDLMKQGSMKLPNLPQGAGFWDKFWFNFSRISSIIGRSLQFFVVLVIFLFRFFEWWYSPTNRMRTNIRRLPVPPPPPPTKRANQGLELPADKTLCPICLHTRDAPACSPSGFVFCYRCIFNHIQTNGKCPVTLLPCQVGQIRKIFDD